MLWFHHGTVSNMFLCHAIDSGPLARQQQEYKSKTSYWYMVDVMIVDGSLTTCRSLRRSQGPSKWTKIYSASSQYTTPEAGLPSKCKAVQLADTSNEQQAIQVRTQPRDPTNHSQHCRMLNQVIRRAHLECRENVPRKCNKHLFHWARLSKSSGWGSYFICLLVVDCLDNAFHHALQAYNTTGCRFQVVWLSSL